MSAQPLTSKRIWVVSEGRYTDFDLGRVVKDGGTETVREYRISQLARYMLDPRPVEVKKRLIGCEIYPPADRPSSLRRRLAVFSRKEHDAPGPQRQGSLPETILDPAADRRPAMRDPELEAHLERIEEMVRPFDPTRRRIQSLDLRSVADIVGICREPGGNQSYLTLQGSVSEKRQYMVAFLSRPVPVVIERSRVSEGLFEMSGFDFAAFDPDREFRLLKFRLDGSLRSCVLRPSGRLDFWVDDFKGLGYLQLLQESIDADPKLSESFFRCANGDVRPVKIFFNTELSIDYSKAYLPPIYRELLEAHPEEANAKAAIVDSLRHKQLGVAFNFIPESETGDEKLFTNLSVMHEVSALEPIRENLPRIYSALAKRAAVSEAGRFYLLDSIKGYRNER